MSRFSITVDDDLLEAARALAQTRTKREAIELALRELVQRRRLAKLAELAGSDIVEIDNDDLQRWRRMAVPPA